MSIEMNLELARAMFAAVASGDTEALDALLTDDYTLHDAVMADQSSRAGFMEQVSQIRERYVDPEFIIHDIFGVADRVALRWTLAGEVRLPSDGATRCIAHDGMSILRISGGKIAEEWAVYDELGLQRQLGRLDDSTTT